MSSGSGDGKPVVEPSPADGEAQDPTSRSFRLRIRQQEILAELGVFALRGSPFMELLDETARLTAEGLHTEFCKVLEFEAALKRLIVRAGVGWHPAAEGDQPQGQEQSAGGCQPASAPVQRFRKRRTYHPVA